MPNSDQQKQELASKVIEQLQKTKEVDLRLFLIPLVDIFDLHGDLVSEIAQLLRQTDKYDVMDSLAGSTYIIRHKPRKKFNEEHPIWFAIIMAVIGATLALGGGILIETRKERLQTRLHNQQERHLLRLSDSLNNLRNDLRDSIASVRADTSLVNP